MRRAAMRSVVLALALLTSACFSADPTRAIMTLTSAAGLNPNSQDQPSPLVVRIYELKAVDIFNQLSFFDLYDQDVQKLGGDLLNRREIEVKPGTEQVVTREADPAARFVGVIAGYRTVQDITWRGSAPLEPESRNRIKIQLDPRSLTVEKVKRSRFLWIF